MVSQFKESVRNKNIKWKGSELQIAFPEYSCGPRIKHVDLKNKGTCDKTLYSEN